MLENAEKNLKKGIDVYNDNQKFENELATYTTIKEKNKFLNKYLKENDMTEKDLLQSHIIYLKKEYDTLNKRNYRFFLLVIMCCVVVAVVFNVKNIYKKFYGISIDNKTYVQAREYYNKGKYNEASVRLQKLISNGFDGYAIYYYCSRISKSEGDYDSSAAAIEYFINQYYGIENITYDSRVYNDLKWAYDEGGLSPELSTRILELLNKASLYAKEYKSIDTSLDNENYLSVVHTCKLLLNEGACNYKLTVAYVYSLVMIKDYMTAYDYILHYLETLSLYQEHTVSKEQRIILLEFIRQFLDGDNYNECCNHLKQLQNIKDTPSGQDTPYELSAEGATDYNSAKEYIPTLFKIINYASSFDTFFIERNTCIVRGRECYLIEATHKNGGISKTNYFFYSREQSYLYILLNGEYIDITSVMENPSDGGNLAEGLKTSTGKYINDNGIEIIISEGDSFLFNFCIKDTNTGEVLLKKENVPWDVYTAYTDDYLELNFIWGEKLIILVKMDVLNKYGKIESVYTLDN